MTEMRLGYICVPKAQWNDAQDAVDKLRAINADLLAALEFYIGGEPGPEYVEYRSPAAVRKVVRAAIAKAKEG